MLNLCVYVCGMQCRRLSVCVWGGVLVVVAGVMVLAMLMAVMVVVITHTLTRRLGPIGRRRPSHA